jgi:hypothetical protein
LLVSLDRKTAGCAVAVRFPTWDFSFFFPCNAASFASRAPSCLPPSEHHRPFPLIVTQPVTSIWSVGWEWVEYDVTSIMTLSRGWPLLHFIYLEGIKSRRMTLTVHVERTGDKSPKILQEDTTSKI